MPNNTEKPRIGNKVTLRQQKLATIMLADTGKSFKRAMQEAGYKKGYAKNPHSLRKTLGWQELMDKYLPDKLLMRYHRKLMRKKEYIAIGKAGEREVIATGEIDSYAVSKALELGYKIKSKMKGEEGAPTPVTVNIINYGDPIKPKEGDKPTV